jgi:hypothetical protein
LRFSVLSTLAALSCLSSTINADTDPATALAELAKKTTEAILTQLDAQEAALKKQGLRANCTRKNIAYHQEL